MKHKRTELDVDFIGGQGSLTKEEEKAISEYLKAKKVSRIKKDIRKKTHNHSRKKTLLK